MMITTPLENHIETVPKIAAICVEKFDRVDSVLAEVVNELERDDSNIAGFLQCEEDAGNSACCSDMYLKDIASNERFRITQSLGSGSQGCKLDPNGLVDAVSHMSGQIDSSIDLLILNRFGKGEEEGRGFRPVIEAAFMASVPVLIVVRDTYLDAWRDFTGGDFQSLPVDASAILNWCRKWGGAPNTVYHTEAPKMQFADAT